MYQNKVGKTDSIVKNFLVVITNKTWDLTNRYVSIMGYHGGTLW